MACGHEREAVLSQLYLFSDYTETIKWHLPSPHALAHSPPSPKTSGTLSSFVNSPMAMPPATQIFPSAGGIPSLNKGLLDERATIVSHSVTRSRNILWGFLYSGLILEDPRGEGTVILVCKGTIAGMCPRWATFWQRGRVSIQEHCSWK